jgi:hypothetical protein
MKVAFSNRFFICLLLLFHAGPVLGHATDDETGPGESSAESPGNGEDGSEDVQEEDPEDAVKKVVLSEEEVTAVMESDAVREAFYECASLHAHPTHIDFSFIVNAKGKVTLFGTDPEVSQELFSCFRAVTRVVEFEGKGEKFEITYPMKLPPYLEIKKKKSQHPKKTAGWILFGVGYAVFAAGAACGTAAIIMDRDLEDECPDLVCGPGKRGTVDTMRALALSADVLLGVGGALTVTGIILLALNVKQEKQKEKGKGKPSRVGLLAPAGLSLTWEF